MNLFAEIKRNKLSFYYYIFLNVLTIIFLIYSLIIRNYGGVSRSLLAIVLYFVPALIKKIIRADFPLALELILLSFVFFAQILGEGLKFYHIFTWWDKFLHISTGFLAAAVGYYLASLLSRDKQDISPLLTVLVAFCFSMTVGVMWEFFEFATDYLFNLNSQRDTIITTLRHAPVIGYQHKITIYNIQKVIVNGKALRGYIDIGLLDTMGDLFVNFLGTVSFIGLSFIGDNHRMVKYFIPYQKHKKSNI